MICPICGKQMERCVQVEVDAEKLWFAENEELYFCYDDLLMVRKLQNGSIISTKIGDREPPKEKQPWE